MDGRNDRSLKKGNLSIYFFFWVWISYLVIVEVQEGTNIPPARCWIWGEGGVGVGKDRGVRLVGLPALGGKGSMHLTSETIHDEVDCLKVSKEKILIFLYRGNSFFFFLKKRI